MITRKRKNKYTTVQISTKLHKIILSAAKGERRGVREFVELAIAKSVILSPGDITLSQDTVEKGTALGVTQIYEENNLEFIERLAQAYLDSL